MAWAATFVNISAENYTDMFRLCTPTWRNNDFKASNIIITFKITVVWTISSTRNCDRLSALQSLLFHRAGFSERGALVQGRDGGTTSSPTPPHHLFTSVSFLIPYPPFPLPLPLPSPFPLPPPLPLPSSLPLPGAHTLSPPRGSGERCKLPQRVRAEPCRQTVCGAFWAKRSLLVIVIHTGFFCKTNCCY